MGFQENLRHYREKAGYTQSKDFAKVLGIPYPTYVGYESQGREPKYNTLKKIADLLNVSTDELLGRKNNILGKNDNEELAELINSCIKDKVLFSFSNLENQPKIKLKNIDDKYIYFDLFIDTTSKQNKSVEVSVIKEFFIQKINDFNKFEEINKLEKLKSLTIYETLKSAEAILKGYYDFTWNEIEKEQTNALKDTEGLVKALTLLKSILNEQERLAVAKETFLKTNRYIEQVPICTHDD